MLQSLVALPFSALALTALFLLLYRYSPLDAKTSAMVTALLSLGAFAASAVIYRPGADVIAMYVAVLAVTAYLLGIVGGSRERRLAEGGDSGFHWGPSLILLFFVILFAADGLFVVISSDGLPAPIARWLLPERQGAPVQSVFPGVVPRDYQKKEYEYNEYLARLEAQKARGWRIRKGWIGSAIAGRAALFQVSVTDNNGDALTGAWVTGLFQRPSDSRMDRPFDMQETEAGIYQVEITLSQPGRCAIASPY